LSPSRYSIAAKHSHLDFVSQEMFLQILCLERKRSERSGRMFLLALVDAGDLSPQDRETEKIPAKLEAIIGSSIRETDIGGWYKASSVAGIIFTEIAISDRETTQQVMFAKLTEALRKEIQHAYADRIRITFHFFPDHWADENSGLSADETFYPDLVKDGGEKPRKVSRGMKRVIDVTGSLMALIVLSPVFLAIAIAIKLTSEGPVFFRQKRIGQYGVPFTFLKFRSMKNSNDPSIHREYVKRLISGDPGVGQGANGEGVTYKITDDPRVTRVGKFIRKTSLDELPQFWSVLVGDMSLVGPRPPIAYEVDAYAPWHRRRVMEARPGITGLWQVTGRSKMKFDDMVRQDLRYVKMWSVWLDLKILLMTPREIFWSDGAH
jgi:exopolysaccharide biosynthesis polyprenyl glycosylphosphotransferase